MRLSLLCFFMLLISLSSTTSLNLYATSPTTPSDLPNSSCCLPQGPVGFQVINQTYVDSELVDIVLIQADQWLGQGCSINNVTSLSPVTAYSINVTIDGVDNTIRGLTTTFSEEICNTFLYVSDPNPQSLYAYGPTTPPFAPTPYYCLPRGPIIYVPVGQTIDDSDTTYDIVLLQAEQWNGPACAFEDITESSVVLGYGANITDYQYATRFLQIGGANGGITNLYDSPLTYSLDLYSAGPTIPADMSDSLCCIPVGPVTLVMVTQMPVDSTPCDIVYAEADQWVGSGCADININLSGFSIAPAWSKNITPPIYPGNTYRWLDIVIVGSGGCGSSLYDSNPDPLIGTNIPSEVLACLSILACLWLFYRYYKSPRNSFSVQLILVLSISDFFFHICCVIMLNEGFNISSGFMAVVQAVDFMQDFSIFWSTTVSIILMKAFSSSGTLRQVNARMWILFLLPSLVLAAIPLILNNLVGSALTSVLVQISILVIPVAITIGCYIRTIRVIRNHPSGIIPKYHALLLYPAVQLVLFVITALPNILNADPNLSFNTKRVFSTITNLPKGLMGLANAAIYLLQNRKRTVVSQPKQDDNSNESLLRADT